MTFECPLQIPYLLLCTPHLNSEHRAHHWKHSINTYERKEEIDEQTSSPLTRVVTHVWLIWDVLVIPWRRIHSKQQSNRGKMFLVASRQLRNYCWKFITWISPQNENLWVTIHWKISIKYPVEFPYCLIRIQWKQKSLELWWSVVCVNLCNPKTVIMCHFNE